MMAPMDRNQRRREKRLPPRAVAIVIALLLGQPVLAASWNVTLMEVRDAPQLERQRLERAYLGHPGGAATDGWNLSLEDARFELDTFRSQIQWKSVSLASLADARSAAQQAEKAGQHALVVNLPASWTASLAALVKLPIINVGSGADELREIQCQRNLFHAMPSDRMRIDAISQSLVLRKWMRVLLLVGPSDEDRVRGAAVQVSLRRMGLKLVAERKFKISADPRERELTNSRLLTSGSDFDVVWVVDGDGEFARSLPYNVQAARPVVGDAGLVAVGWHSQFERYGGPQLSRRFAKNYRRAMTQHDWASWMAGKAVSLAASSLSKAGSSELIEALNSLSLDGSKGVSMQFRTWDGQLRQPMLLTDGQGVIGVAPVDGALHPRNVLDTLGADSTERLCPNRP